MSEDPEFAAHQTSDARTLYVVLQGEFALYHEVAEDPDDDDTLHIMAPYVPDHVYLAGPWLTDWNKADELPQYLNLCNAFGNHKNARRHCTRSLPENNLDLILNVGPPGSIGENAKVHIEAPMPVAILSGLTQATPSVQIEVTNGPGDYSYPAVPENPTVIPILVYKWYGAARPYLEDDDGNTVAESGGPDGPGDHLDPFQSLQIYATSPIEEINPQHPKDAFAAAAFLLGVTATIDWKDGRQFAKTQVSPPAGLSFAQINWFLPEVINASRADLKSDENPHPLDRLQFAFAGSGNCGPLTHGH